MSEKQPQLELVTTLELAFNPPEVIGPGPQGIRVIFGCRGGEVSGPRLRGKAHPSGGDWLTIRRDGIGVVDARATLEADDGALVYVAYQGVLDLGLDGYEAFLRQQTPAAVSVHTALRFDTASPEHSELNRLQCIGIGRADLQHLTVSYDVYALSTS